MFSNQNPVPRAKVQISTYISPGVSRMLDDFTTQTAYNKRVCVEIGLKLLFRIPDRVRRAMLSAEPELIDDCTPDELAKWVSSLFAAPARRR